ncbi:esterase [Aureisphaera galaxeae]|uniref:alpha/beta hydrolase n=1 Tax=Aureisphaera galaxeae TaxID=1538023 RepID=UPI0023508745|nr:esterase [Aureisphaera galaxeae]MDC8004638.1 esterase [Aureisphaera galaxeae]
MIVEKDTSYTMTSTYSVVNTYSEKTKNVWLVFHGMGYLSRYFARYFEGLNPEENFIIVPQAPSKYYQGPKFKHVGASWLTRENTVAETKNVLAYVDSIWEREKPEHLPNFVVVGYSQGVSIAARWLSSRKISCNTLVLHSGAFPKELGPPDFDYLPEDTQVMYLYGDKDQYVTEAKLTEESLKGSEVFGNRLSVTVFDGIHEVNVPFLSQLVEE